MKKTVFTLFLAQLTFCGLTQSYSSPESVEKNVPDNNYFVANTGSSQVLKLLPSGTLQNFASGISAGPYGLELVGDTLYACNGGSIMLLDRNTGALIQGISLGATFLNGITHKGHNLYITDFSAKKIYRFNTLNNSFNVFAGPLAKTPNGIIYDDINDRLVFVTWGSSAPIYELSLADSSINLLTTTTVGNIDGIAMDCQGNFYISSWSPNSIRKYNSTFTSSSVVATSGITSPADIYFDGSKDSLYVPNSGSANNVVKVSAPSCLTTGVEENANLSRVHVFPNPSAGEYVVDGLEFNSRLQVTNLSGQTIYQNNVSASRVSIDLSFAPAGIYLLEIVSATGTQSIRLVR